MADVFRRDKGRFDHVAHEQVTNPFGILPVCLVPFLRFGIFGVGKNHFHVVLFQNIKNRDPVLSGGFHTDLNALVFFEPVSEFLQSFGKGRKPGLFIFRASVCIGDPDAGIDPCFVDIQSTAVLTKDFKSQEKTSCQFILTRPAVTGRPAKSSRLWKR